MPIARNFNSVNHLSVSDMKVSTYHFWHNDSRKRQVKRLIFKTIHPYDYFSEVSVLV